MTVRSVGRRLFTSMQKAGGVSYNGKKMYSSIIHGVNTYPSKVKIVEVGPRDGLQVLYAHYLSGVQIYLVVN
jgi:hypothetical protein